MSKQLSVTDSYCLCEHRGFFGELELLTYDPMCPVHGQLGIS